MVMFGDAAVAQVLLSAGQTSAPGGNGFGDYQSINWGWALGVMLGIYVAGDSGAFLKYAVLESFVISVPMENLLTRANQSRDNLHKLHPPQTPLAPLPHLLPRAIPRRLLRLRRRLHQLHQQHQPCRGRPRDPDSSTRRNSHSRDFLHVPAAADDEGRHVLLGVHRFVPADVFDLCAEG